MKKLLLLTALMAALGLTSCGEDKGYSQPLPLLEYIGRPIEEFQKAFENAGYSQVTLQQTVGGEPYGVAMMAGNTIVVANTQSSMTIYTVSVFTLATINSGQSLAEAFLASDQLIRQNFQTAFGSGTLQLKNEQEPTNYTTINELCTEISKTQLSDILAVETYYSIRYKEYQLRGTYQYAPLIINGAKTTTFGSTYGIMR